MEFDIKEFHISDQEHSIELPSIAGDSNLVPGEKQYSPPEQVPAIHKRRARREKNTPKHEVTFNRHNTLYRVTPAPPYHAAITRPIDCISLKLLTHPQCSSSVNVYKNSLANDAGTIPSTSVFRSTTATSSSQRLYIASIQYVAKLRQAAPQDKCHYQPLHIYTYTYI
ncbi:unnamed protein product [Hymenolepis diminuta]|uniref:Uncharacterized protein n=1 Tax=Hymenolepis diminuta TaxID=6216 RepID=A0A564XVR3_HYMDI|nr:unnamed protein product [Hymenolepis diminuta]